MNRFEVLLALLAAGAITFALRALPFLAAQWLQQRPAVQRLGRFLPLAVMVLLALHSGLNAGKTQPTYPLPELTVMALVAALQWRWRHPLLSILGGALIYGLWRNGGF